MRERNEAEAVSKGADQSVVLSKCGIETLASVTASGKYYYPKSVSRSNIAPTDATSAAVPHRH